MSFKKSKGKVIRENINFYKKIISGDLSAKSLKESLSVLELLISGGFSIWEDGSLYEIRQLVCKVKGLKIEIYSREHSPPHFHITGNNIDAVFSIIEGKYIQGNIDGRIMKLIECWYIHNRALLINTWNKTRPNDCPVGPISE